jgi:hypothetical protein
MPVIRGEPAAKAITHAQRKNLVNQLKNELSGQLSQNGPVIFEIPLEQSDKIDVLVVWDAWEPFRSEDRSSVILEAYKEQKRNIAQALGVTYREALEQQVLPYAVIPMVRRGEVNAEELKKAMIAEGGFSLEGGKFDLRFPTMALAEQAHRRLSDKLPKGYWSIVQTVGHIP